MKTTTWMKRWTAWMLLVGAGMLIEARATNAVIVVDASQDRGALNARLFGVCAAGPTHWFDTNAWKAAAMSGLVSNLNATGMRQFNKLFPFYPDMTAADTNARPSMEEVAVRVGADPAFTNRLRQYTLYGPTNKYPGVPPATQFRPNYGPHEYAEYARSFGMRPYAMTPVLFPGYGDPTFDDQPQIRLPVETATNWVKYLNAPTNDPMGLLRAANGRPEPFACRYFILGNEEYWASRVSGGRYSMQSARTNYVEQVRLFVPAMKAVDSNILVGLQIAAGNQPDLTTGWNEPLLDEVGDLFDFIAIHKYASSFTNALTEDMIKFTLHRHGLEETVDGNYSRITNLVNDYEVASGRNLEIMLDEFGVAWMNTTNRNMSCSLLAAFNYIDQVRMAQDMGFDQATYYNLALSVPISLIGPTNGNVSGSIARPPYHAFVMLRNRFATNLVASQVPQTPVERIGPNPNWGNQTFTNVPLVSAWAARDEDDRRLTVLVMNKSFSNAISTRFNLSGFEPAATASVWTLTSTNITDHNEDVADKVAPVESSLSGVSTSFLCALPPRSIRLFTFYAAEGGGSTGSTAWTNCAYRQKILSPNPGSGRQFCSPSICGTQAFVGAIGESRGYFYGLGGDNVWRNVGDLNPGLGPGSGFGIASAWDTNANLLLVGAFRTNTAGGATRSGVVFVYTNAPGGWLYTGTICPSNNADREWDDQFGVSVCAQDRFAYIGAHQDDAPGANEAGAVYVFERVGTQWIQRDKRRAPTPVGGARYGADVDISGETMVVGEWRKTSGSMSECGAAYVYQGSGLNWTLATNLLPSVTDSPEGDSFGECATVDGDTMAIGAFYDEDESNLYRCGSVYLYRRDTEGAWRFVEPRLYALDRGSDDQFGVRARLENGRLMVGAWNDDDGGNNAGAVYAYELVGGVETGEPPASTGYGLTYVETLCSPTPAQGAWFGCPGIDGAYAAIGAPNTNAMYFYNRQPNGTWTYGGSFLPPLDNEGFGCAISIKDNQMLVGGYTADAPGGGEASGAVYVFTNVNGSWNHYTTLYAAEVGDRNADDQFGVSAALYGNYAYVTAHQDDDGPTNDVGALYIFERVGSSWYPRAKLRSPEPQADARFGADVDVDGNTMVVGAWTEDVGPYADCGRVYVYEGSGTNWTCVTNLMPGGYSIEGDAFGESVAIDGDWILVGAHDDERGTNNPYAGSAYVFRRNALGAWEQVMNKVFAPSAASWDYFGVRCSMDDGYAMIGAWNRDACGYNTGATLVYRVGAIANARLDVSAEPGGYVPATGDWYAVGTTVELVATPEAYYRFNGWQGPAPYGGNGSNPMLIAMPTGTLSLTATFAACVTTNTGVPLAWLANHGIVDDFESASLLDPDGDGMPTWREYRADTRPTDGDSCLRLEGEGEGVQGRLRWFGGSEAWQYLERTDDLAAGNWVTLLTNAPPTARTNEIAVYSNGYYRVRAER